MIQVSETFKQLMKSNIRPKCEPFIRVYGEDNTGKEVFLEWKASNIKELKYRRGIDLLGRTLPYMELEWTEVFLGKIDENSNPEKYNNITKYMAVELSFIQDLGEHGTWDYLYKNKITWADLYKNKITWRSLFNGRYMGESFAKKANENIIFPTLFLDARPIIEGNTIKWTAKDVLYFLQETQNKIFLPSPNHPNKITDNKIVSNLIADNRSAYRKSPQLFNALTKTIDAIVTNTVSFEVIENLACNDSTINLAKNIYAVFNKYLDFENDYAIVKNAYEEMIAHISKTPEFVFTSNIMLKYPTITHGASVSAYDFKKYFVGLLAESTEPYLIESGSKYTYNNVSFDVYQFKGYGQVDQTGIFATDGVRAIQYQGQGVFVVPYDVVNSEQHIGLNNIGEPYIEDNPQCIYDIENQKQKVQLLKQYFSNKSTLEFSSLPNISLEPNDVIGIETNTFKNNKRIQKKAIIVGIEIDYNGVFHEKIIAHEVE